MSLIDDVRRALQPLMERGIVIDVRWGAQAGVPEKKIFLVTIDAPDPESQRAEIERLIEEAGLADRVLAHLHWNPQRA